MSLIRFFNNDWKKAPLVPTKLSSLARRFSGETQSRDIEEEHLNGDPHTLVTFAADTSGSMTEVTEQFNSCQSTAFTALKKYPSVARRVDVEVVSAGGVVTTELPFTSLVNAEPEWLSAGGGTPLGAAAIQSLDDIRKRVDWLRSKEIAVTSSILVIISDGGANDCREVIQEAKQRLRRAQNENIAVIPLLTCGGDRKSLEDFCGCRCLEIERTDIEALFLRLTSVIRTVSMMSPSQFEGPGAISNLMFEGE